MAKKTSPRVSDCETSMLCCYRPGSTNTFGTLVALEADSRQNVLERAWNWVLRRDLTDHAPLYYALQAWNRIPE
jgi:hypothetical protein